MKSQTRHQTYRDIFQKANLWFVLISLCVASLLPACSPIESGSTNESLTPNIPQAFQPTATIENLMTDSEKLPKATPQPTSTKECPPQESTQETTASVSVPRTPSSTEGSASNPDLIDLTEREFPDETASAPDCGTVTPSPVPPTGEETPGE